MKQLILPDPNDDIYDSIDPLDSRYYDPDISRYLSERSRIAYQAHVEAALAHALADVGICSRQVAEQIDDGARQISAADVYHEEQTTKHDIKAVVNCIKAKIDDDAKPYVHFGATSYDIISTATALQFKTATLELLIPRLRQLLMTLVVMTEKYAETTQIGRTHGQHAVPITFGFMLSGYVSRLGESMEALEDLAGGLRGKFSGAVGSYNALSVFVDDPLKFEQTVLGYLDLPPAPHSTQIVPAEGVVRLIDELAITAGIMANLAHDMRHLQRSEIAETREKFEKGQTGSSTMAHKRNPWNFENVISMSKQVTAQIVNANLNISSEHQRDLTDSASSRFYGVAFASVASMAHRLERVMGRLEVDDEAMARNLAMSGGAIAAEPLYLLLEKYGHTTGHEAAKAVAHRALDEQRPLHEVIQDDAELTSYWEQFTDSERTLLTYPETHYTGLASKKALEIAKYWKTQLG